MDKVVMNTSETFAVYDRESLNNEIEQMLDDETVKSFEIVREVKAITKENEDLELEYFIVGVLRDLT